MVEKNVFFRLNGGMGNQLSQYAAAINYKKKYKKNIKFDDFYIKKSKKKHEVISLDNLFVNVETVSCVRSKISRFINRVLFKLGRESIPILGFIFYFEKIDFVYTGSSTIIVEGFWQINTIYTDEVIDNINKALEDKVNKLDPKFQINEADEVCVAVHVRRGDYITNKYTMVLPDQYYLNAYEKIKRNIDKKICTYIFTDDTYDKNIFKSYSDNFIKIERKKYTDIESFYFFTKFKKCVVANSTYSMWAALISKKYNLSDVYAPGVWHKTRQDDLAIIPKEFTIIPVN